MIGESLATGYYNRMSKDMQHEISKRFKSAINRPTGRMRRGPWFKNRVNDIRRIYNETVLFETLDGVKKNRVARLFILDIVANQRPSVFYVEVNARTFVIDVISVSVFINNHAMSRIIQYVGSKKFTHLHKYLKSIIFALMSNIDNEKHEVKGGQSLRVATEFGLSFWDVDEHSEGNGVGFTLKTFIGKEVLDGHNLEKYHLLMEKDLGKRYLLVTKRKLDS